MMCSLLEAKISRDGIPAFISSALAGDIVCLAVFLRTEFGPFSSAHSCSSEDLSLRNLECVSRDSPRSSSFLASVHQPQLRYRWRLPFSDRARVKVKCEYVRGSHREFGR